MDLSQSPRQENAAQSVQHVLAAAPLREDARCLHEKDVEIDVEMDAASPASAAFASVAASADTEIASGRLPINAALGVVDVLDLVITGDDVHVNKPARTKQCG
eukprot:scpid90196/ scgid19641/ 